MKVIDFKIEKSLYFGFNQRWFEIECGSKVSIPKEKAIEYAINFLDEIKALPSGGFVSYGAGLYAFEHSSGDDMKLVVNLTHPEAYDLANFILDNANN